MAKVPALKSADSWPVFSNAFENLESRLFGFDPFSEVMRRFQNTVQAPFPPFDVFRYDNHYTVEMAVAGYNRGDLEVTLDDKNTLTIRGKSSKETVDSHRDTLHKGIAKREFAQSFQINPDVTVESYTATLRDGILCVSVEVAKDSPKEKVRTIQID